MAIAFLEMKTISRATKTKGKGGVYVSNGASSVAASAYRAGVKLLDEQTGIVHDYRPRSKKDGDVEALPVIVPDGEAPIERGELWNQVEATETRKNSMLAREMVIALPRETSREANRRMAQAMGEKLAKEFGVAVDVCIHSGRDKKDHEGSGNPHMHVLFTTRRYKSGELGEKTRELNDKTTSSGHVENLRQFWQKICNEELARIHVESIDMRSYARQGIQKTPQIKLGRAAHHLHKRTGESYLAARNSQIKTVNIQVEADHARRIVSKLLSVADQFGRKAERLDAAAREGAAPAASSQPKEKAKSEPDAGAGRSQAAPQVPLDPRAEADKRARGLYSALSDFINGGGEKPEIRAAERVALRDALKACGLTESAANLELSDVHGNKGPHLIAAAAKRLTEQKGMSIAEMREAREIGSLFAAVKSAAVGAGYRYDVKARNLDGQLSFDVQRDGLKRLPPAVAKAVAKAVRWTAGRSRRGASLQATGRIPALRAQAQLDQQRRPAHMQLSKRFGAAAPPPRPVGFQSFGAVGDASSFSRVSSGGFPAVVGVAASSSSFDTGGGARAAGGMQAPPPGLPPKELDAWLFAYKRAAEVQRAADEEKRRRAFSR